MKKKKSLGEMSDKEIADDIRRRMQRRGINSTEAYLSFLRDQKARKMDASLARAKEAEREMYIIDRMLGGEL